LSTPRKVGESVADAKKKGMLAQLRESALAKAVDKGLEVADKVLGPEGKNWLSNGLDELRQAVQPAFATQGGTGPLPAYGVPTQGEVTAERMEGDKSKEQTLRETYEVPSREGKLSLASMRASVAEAKETEQPGNGLAHEAQQRDQEHAMEM